MKKIKIVPTMRRLVEPEFLIPFKSLLEFPSNVTEKRFYDTPTGVLAKKGLLLYKERLQLTLERPNGCYGSDKYFVDGDDVFGLTSISMDTLEPTMVTFEHLRILKSEVDFSTVVRTTLGLLWEDYCKGKGYNGNIPDAQTVEIQLYAEPTRENINFLNEASTRVLDCYRGQAAFITRFDLYHNLLKYLKRKGKEEKECWISQPS